VQLINEYCMLTARDGLDGVQIFRLIFQFVTTIQADQ